METVVELEDVNGEWWNLTNGDRGVWLGTDPKGLYDPPVKVVYEEPGNYPGARYLNHRVLRRDVVFGVEILNDKGAERSWMSRDSEWRKGWAYDRDCKLYVTTNSGTRYLKLRLGEQPDVSLQTDPNNLTLNRVGMVCIAGDPFWYENDVVYSATTKKDTRFDPTFFPPFGIADALIPSETLTITVDPSDGRGGLNPTDQYIFPKWTVPGAQDSIPNFPWPFPPGIPIPWEKAPVTIWTLPDYSFEDEALANRRLRLPGLIKGENCVVDTDPRVEQVSSESRSQVWARMNGVRFRHPIPSYTEKKTFEITVSGTAPGEMVTLRLPRPWSRPWGLE